MPSSSSSSAQQARQALADQLREIRLAAGLTGSALASRAGWHGVSKVSKIEHGVRPTSGDDVGTWSRVCAVPPERAEELLAEQRAVAGMWVPYQQLNRAGLRKAQESVRGQFRQCPARGEIGADRGGDRMVSGDHGLHRVTAGQVYLRVTQLPRAQQGGDTGDQRAGGARLAATELAEQVPLGAHDVDAVRLSMLEHSLGEFGK